MFDKICITDSVLVFKMKVVGIIVYNGSHGNIIDTNDIVSSETYVLDCVTILKQFDIIIRACQIFQIFA